LTENQEKYNSDTPPEIVLNKIRDAGVPIAIVAGRNDLLATVEDAKWTLGEINGPTSRWPIVTFDEI